jgi:hypothetical protein
MQIDESETQAVKTRFSMEDSFAPDSNVTDSRDLQRAKPISQRRSRQEGRQIDESDAQL